MDVVWSYALCPMNGDKNPEYANVNVVWRTAEDVMAHLNKMNGGKVEWHKQENGYWVGYYYSTIYRSDMVITIYRIPMMPKERIET